MNIFDIAHLFFEFYPAIIYFIPIKYSVIGFRYVFLIFICTPLHWIYFDNKCILTIISSKQNDNLKNEQSIVTSSFSKQYLWWLYNPICNLFKWGINDQAYSKAINLHFFANYGLMWYYMFFIAKDKLF